MASAPGKNNSYYWDRSYNPNATFGLCLPNCTTYAYGRPQELGKTPPVTRIANGGQWHNYVNTAGGWKWMSWSASYQLKPGDVIDYNAQHVAVVEGSGSGLGVAASASWFTGMDGTSGSDRISGSGWKGGWTVNSMGDIYDWATSVVPNRYFHNGTVGGEGTPAYILVAPGGGGGGGGGGDEPDVPDPVSRTLFKNANTPFVTEDLVTDFNNEFGSRIRIYWGTSSGSQNSEISSSNYTISGHKFTLKSSWLAANLEPSMITPDTMEKDFYLRARIYDGDGYEREYHNGFKFTVKIPDTFKPDVKFTNIRAEGINHDGTKGTLFGGCAISGYSRIFANYSIESTAPEGYTNHATIQDGWKITCDDLVLDSIPTELSGVVSGRTYSNYNNQYIVFTGKAVDSREIEIKKPSEPTFEVRGYRYPGLVVHSITRGTPPNVNAEGNRYIELNWSIEPTNTDIGNEVKLEDVKVFLEGVQSAEPIRTEVDGSYTITVGGDLDPEKNYSLQIQMHDSIMAHYGMPDILSAPITEERMPISLLNTHNNNVGVAFGTEALLENVVEFAPFMYMKATDMSTGTEAMETAFDVINAGNTATQGINALGKAVVIKYGVNEELEKTAAMIIREISQEAYDGLGPGRPANTLYCIPEEG